MPNYLTPTDRPAARQLQGTPPLPAVRSLADFSRRNPTGPSIADADEKTPIPDWAMTPILTAAGILLYLFVKRVT